MYLPYHYNHPNVALQVIVPGLIKWYQEQNKNQQVLILSNRAIVNLCLGASIMKYATDVPAANSMLCCPIHIYFFFQRAHVDFKKHKIWFYEEKYFK